MKTEAALARSSEEVSRALDQFLLERQDAAEAQDRALQLYEAEMLHITAEGDEEERVAMYAIHQFVLTHTRAVNERIPEVWTII